MEQVENPIILPEPIYRSQTDFDRYYEAMAEKEDIRYQDKIFEEEDKDD